MHQDLDSSNNSLFFRAGYLAAEHGLPHAVLATREGIDGLHPNGPPVVVVLESSDMTVQVVRDMAAVAGAGRQVLLMSQSGGVPDAVRPWLGDRIKILGSSGTDEDQVSPSTGTADAQHHDSQHPTTARSDTPGDPTDALITPGWTTEDQSPNHSHPHIRDEPPIDPPDVAGAYCGVEWAADPLAQGGSQGLKYLNRLVREFKLEGTWEGTTLAALFPSTPKEFASWFEFLACRALGREWIAIRTPIAVSSSGNYWSASARDALGWYVLRWTEQPSPKHERGFRRLMGRSKPPPDQVVPEDVCFHGSDERPNRFLSLSDRLVVTRAHGLAHPQLVDLGDRSAVLLEYRLPLVAWPDFKRWASTSITSLLRVLHLLYQPQWSAWTARDVLSEGPAITRLLSSHRALPFGVAGKRLAGSGGEPLKAPGPINLWRH